jgi:hypothetical protein
LRAERLLSAVKGLSPTRSTYQDAIAVLHEYENQAEIEPGCSEAQCKYKISQHTGFVTSEFLSRLIPMDKTLSTLSVLGVRPISVHTIISITHGIVARRDFYVYYYRNGYSLMAIARTVKEIRPEWDTKTPRSLAFNRPGGCEVCQATYAEVTPDANSAEIAKAFNFNFSCFASFRPCQRVTDLMPSAPDFYKSTHQ